MEQQCILQQIDSHYAIGPVLSLQPTDHGGVWLVETPTGRFAAKAGQRPDHLNAHRKAQAALEQHGLRTSHVVPTSADACMTPQGLALFTWLEGENLRTLSAAQREAAIAYIRPYLAALATEPFSGNELARVNGWDDAQSPDYLMTDFPGLLEGLNLPKDDSKLLLSAVARLRDHWPQLQAGKRQLIHADLGPDNFLFQGDRVVAVIDFTPAYDSALYAFAQFVYWNDLYPATPMSAAGLLERFGACGPAKQNEDFAMALLRVALFRTVGPLLELVRIGPAEWERLRPRTACLRAVLEAMT